MIREPDITKYAFRVYVLECLLAVSPSYPYPQWYRFNPNYLTSNINRTPELQNILKLPSRMMFGHQSPHDWPLTQQFHQCLAYTKREDAITAAEFISKNCTWARSKREIGKVRVAMIEQVQNYEVIYTP